MRFVLYVLFYTVLIGIYVLIYWFVYRKKGYFSLISKTLLCGIVVVISGIRCNFGSDFYSYYRQYNYISDQILAFGGVQRFIENNIQVGYPYLMHIVRKINSSPYVIFWACSIIIYPLMFHWIDKKTTNKTYSVALFFLLGIFDITNNILKQSIALCILLYAFDYLIENKYLHFIVLSVFAVLFHVSALAIIITMVISHFVNLEKRHIILLGILSSVLIVGYTLILTRIISTIPILERYTKYLEGREFTSAFVITSILYTALFAYLGWRFSESDLLSSKDKKRVNLIIISIVFTMLSLRYIVIIRISYMALLQIAILLPQIDNVGLQLNNYKLRISKYMTIVIIFFMITALSAGNNRYYSYSTYFSSEPQIEWYR